MSEFIENRRYKINTPTGFQNFKGIQKLKRHVYTIQLSNKVTLKCSHTHPFIYKNSVILANELKIGSIISGEHEEDIYIEYIAPDETPIDVYDIIGVDNGNVFIVDGVRSHNCDFLTTGNTVVDIPTIEFYKKEKALDPVEIRGNEKGYWIWDYPDYSKNYILSADVARGDGSDYSAFHIFDVETLDQVAEYQGLIGTKEYGNFLVGAATEYNNALLVVENLSIGWAVLQQIIDRNYPNLFYSSADLQYVDVERQMTSRYNRDEKKLVPGFTTSLKTKPLMVSRMEMYCRERGIGLKSKRLLNELSTFVWDGNRVGAMANHHDDLVMALCIGLWVRDTALKLRQQGMELNKSMISSIYRTENTQSIYNQVGNLHAVDTWQMEVGGMGSEKKESLTWLL